MLLLSKKSMTKKTLVGERVYCLNSLVTVHLWGKSGQEPMAGTWRQAVCCSMQHYLWAENVLTNREVQSHGGSLPGAHSQNHVQPTDRHSQGHLPRGQLTSIMIPHNFKVFCLFFFFWFWTKHCWNSGRYYIVTLLFCFGRMSNWTFLILPIHWYKVLWDSISLDNSVHTGIHCVVQVDCRLAILLP